MATAWTDNGWASPTPAELDVVRAVAEGLANVDIGPSACMCRATVKTHLTHAKLGFSSRAELAAAAAVTNPSRESSWQGGPDEEPHRRSLAR